MRQRTLCSTDLDLRPFSSSRNKLTLGAIVETRACERDVAALVSKEQGLQIQHEKNENEIAQERQLCSLYQRQIGSLKQQVKELKNREVAASVHWSGLESELNGLREQVRDLKAEEERAFKQLEKVPEVCRPKIYAGDRLSALVEQIYGKLVRRNSAVTQAAGAPSDVLVSQEVAELTAETRGLLEERARLEKQHELLRVYVTRLGISDVF